MNKTRFLLSAAALTLVAGAAVAQAPVQGGTMPSAVVSPHVVVIDQRAPLTRADVKAEVQAARQDGSLMRYDADSHMPDASKAPLSTADDEPVSPLAVVVVTDQALQPDAMTPDGKPVVFAATVSAATYYPVAIETSQPATRDEVRAELREARLSGETSPFNPDPYVNSPMPATQE